MLFDVEEDRGDLIVGYLVPDSYSVGSSIRITADGQQMAVVEANADRPSVVIAGRHSTGRCGFVLTDLNVPNLSLTPCLEIRDAESDLIIYRRRPAVSVLHSKLFRFETRHNRSTPMDYAIDRFFQLSFPDVDRRGRETASQSFLLKSSDSLYVSARLRFKEYEYSIDSGFQKVCYLQDPYCELAETILALWRDGSDKMPELALREQLALGDSSDYISSLDITDLASLRRGLSRMPEAVEAVLSNPLARSLASRTGDDTPNSTYVSASLESLASFDVVGIRERPETFLDPLAELLEIESDLLSFTSPSNAAVDLAALLRQLPAVTALVDMDLEIYKAVQAAVDANF